MNKWQKSKRHWGNLQFRSGKRNRKFLEVNLGHMTTRLLIFCFHRKFFKFCSVYRRVRPKMVGWQLRSVFERPRAVHSGNLVAGGVKHSHKLQEERIACGPKVILAYNFQSNLQVLKTAIEIKENADKVALFGKFIRAYDLQYILH